MQPAHPANSFNSRPQKQMVGVRQQNLDPEFFQHILRDALDRSQRPDRHEHRRLHFSMGSDELAGARGAAGRFNLQPNGHGGILTEVFSWQSDSAALAFPGCSAAPRDTIYPCRSHAPFPPSTPSPP